MHDERKRNPYPFVLASEVKLREQGRYIVKDVARVDETVIWYGQPKSNKSTVVEDMLLHVAMGWDWMGHKILRPGLCIFVAAERAEITEARLLAFRKRHGIDPDAEIPFVIIDQRPNMKREEDRDRGFQHMTEPPCLFGPATR
jgi:RecA-family ATPase